MYGQLFTILLIAFSLGICYAQWDSGAGTLYKLNVTEDVDLERPTRNYNNLQWLIVGAHVLYPTKRSLIRFEDIPSACTTVNYAMMYLYYDSSGRPSWVSVTEAPFITRTIQAHRVLKSWNETQATTSIRYSDC